MKKKYQDEGDKLGEHTKVYPYLETFKLIGQLKPQKHETESLPELSTEILITKTIKENVHYF